MAAVGVFVAVLFNTCGECLNGRTTMKAAAEPTAAVALAVLD